jgi:hypothetical protein
LYCWTVDKKQAFPEHQWWFNQGNTCDLPNQKLAIARHFSGEYLTEQDFSHWTMSRVKEAAARTDIF